MALIHSGASGSGSMQIQVAKALGADVATTVRSDAKAEFAKMLGADLTINTRDEDFVERIKTWTHGNGVDVVIADAPTTTFSTSSSDNFVLSLNPSSTLRQSSTTPSSPTTSIA